MISEFVRALGLRRQLESSAGTLLGAGDREAIAEILRRSPLERDRFGFHPAVSVADERGEVAALWRGKPQLYVGRHTDVLDGCAKAEGLSILIRGMNPQVAAVDEVAQPADVRAVVEAAGCGVAVLATVHGTGLDSLGRRPVCRELAEAGVFRRLVVLERRGAERRIRVEALP